MDVKKLWLMVHRHITQDDTLMTTLTIREAVYYSAQLQLPDSNARGEDARKNGRMLRGEGIGMTDSEWWVNHPG
ncbi:hypothetical protein FEM48_Zijuj09G0190500 [Ziziphus jujuba var. spinosa]|uniref:Uncharacterized protein n=1 Tax=Ziziphus jujuba var. spinosa TaxID=714518 RepID=A0A978UUS0_ZIZJJ|nr:hypothetical protein FEM48_Zijuj09G0190500 [Ziziphus jujuba var. spinosa]